jgi:hypothetical protein
LAETCSALSWSVILRIDRPPPVQPAAATGDLLLSQVGGQLLVLGGEPVADPAAGESASLGLEPAAAAQPGDDQAPV